MSSLWMLCCLLAAHAAYAAVIQQYTALQASVLQHCKQGWHALQKTLLQNVTAFLQGTKQPSNNSSSIATAIRKQLAQVNHKMQKQ